MNPDTLEKVPKLKQRKTTSPQAGEVVAEKVSPTTGKVDATKTVTSELRNPLEVQKNMVAEYQRRQTIVEQFVVALKGKKLKPGEVMALIANVMPDIHEIKSLEDQNRYQEVQNAYIFLEYLQASLLGKVRLVPAEVVTNTMLSLLAWIGDLASRGQFYERSKRRWWGLLVNRPDRFEKQDIKDKNLNSSDASFVEIYNFKESVRRLTTETSFTVGEGAKYQTITGFAYEQLRALTVHRRQEVDKMPIGEEVTLPFAALAEKKYYTIVIHRGSWARKVIVEGGLIKDERRFGEFHQKLQTWMSEPLPTNSAVSSEWFDTRNPLVQQQLKKAARRGQAGSESVNSAKKRRTHRYDLAAADLSLAIMQDSEMTLDALQRDYRTDTYGVGIPVALAFGVDSQNQLTRYATKHAHPYTDGAYGVEETKRIANQVFEKRLDRLHAKATGLFTQPDRAQPSFEAAAEQPVIHEVAIPREKYLSRINVIRAFFQDESNLQSLFARHPHFKGKEAMIRRLGQSVNIQNLLSLSIMVAFDHQHANYLEAVRMKDAKKQERTIGLAPAIAVLGPELRKNLAIQKLGPLSEDVSLDLLNAISILDVSRDLTRSGKGPAHIFDTLLAYKFLKSSMQGAGNVLDGQKAAMLTNSTMFSFLVKGTNLWGEPNDYLDLQGFSTAFADSYPDEVFGACDRLNSQTGQEEILLTLRRRTGTAGAMQEKISPAARLQTVEIQLNRILNYLEQYLNE